MARVAHELTTPVSLISGSLENLQESLASLVRYVEATDKYVGEAEEIARLRADLRLERRMRDTAGLLEICVEGARRLSHVIDQLRVGSAADARADGKQSDLRAIIDAAVAMAGHGRVGQPLVVTDCSPSEIWVACNPQSLGQVLLNVVRNAFDAMEGQADARVDVEARLTQSLSSRGGGSRHVAILVRDNGPGIPAERRTRIFEEGFSSKAERGGLGLGLAISSEIMAAVGGRLVLEPSSVGAAFLIEIPAAEAPSTGP
jgi:two-component system sensor histidine kinase HupT/HoxJ